MRAVAVVLSVALFGCFPHNEHARTISKITEGGVIAAGIGLELFANSGGSCSAPMLGVPDSGCTSRPNAGFYSDVGFGLILAGLAGFIATISAAEDDQPTPPPIDIKLGQKAPTATSADLKLPPGVTATPAKSTN